MNTARLLETARAAGLSLEVADGNLVVEADDDPSPELINELRQHKAELIAVLLRVALPTPAVGNREGYQSDAAWWRDLYATRTGHWFHGERRWHEAEGLAWSELQDRWNRAHGERVSSEICSGCRRPIGMEAALDLVDGNRVHDRVEHDCLTHHGARWHAAATRALIAMGLRPPALEGARPS
jgi:hypothetical protein